MAEYYGYAVVPARPRKPKDKASVEMGVNLVERQAIAALRNRRFLSLVDLNRALISRIEAINARPFQKREGSRISIFTDQEKEHLIPLPARPYEIVIRKRVNFNYHICFEGMWYSVPFSYVKREVEVQANAQSVSVYCDGKRVALHKRIYSPKGVIPLIQNICLMHTGIILSGTVIVFEDGQMLLALQQGMSLIPSYPQEQLNSRPIVAVERS